MFEQWLLDLFRASQLRIKSFWDLIYRGELQTHKIESLYALILLSDDILGYEGQRKPENQRENKYLRYKQQAPEKLRSEEEFALTVQRMIVIEPKSVFGQMKSNRAKIQNSGAGIVSLAPLFLVLIRFF